MIEYTITNNTTSNHYTHNPTNESKVVSFFHPLNNNNDSRVIRNHSNLQDSQQQQQHQQQQPLSPEFHSGNHKPMRNRSTSIPFAMQSTNTTITANSTMSSTNTSNTNDSTCTHCTSPTENNVPSSTTQITSPSDDSASNRYYYHHHHHPQQSISFNHSQYMDSFKLSQFQNQIQFQNQQINDDNTANNMNSINHTYCQQPNEDRYPFSLSPPPPPTTATTKSIPNTTTSQKENHSLQPSSSSTLVNHDLVYSPFTPLLHARTSTSLCRSEDSYEKLFQPLNETFQKNLQEYNKSTGSRTTPRKKRRRGRLFGRRRMMEEEDEENYPMDDNYNNSNDADDDDDDNDTFIQTNEYDEQDQERCFICSTTNNDFFLSHLGRWGMKILGIELHDSPLIDSDVDLRTSSGYYNTTTTTTTQYPHHRSFVSYNCDDEDYEDYDEEVAQLQQEEEEAEYKCEYYDNMDQKESYESYDSPLISHNDVQEIEYSSNHQRKHNSNIVDTTLPMLPQLNHDSQDNFFMASLTPRSFYGQYDSEPNGSKSQHPLLCPQTTPKRRGSNHSSACTNTDERRKKGHGGINLSWTTVSSSHSPKHHFVNSSLTNVISLSSSKGDVVVSPTSTTSPLIHHPLVQDVFIDPTATQQRLDYEWSQQQQQQQEEEEEQSNSNALQDDVTIASSSSPKHHLLHSTVASIEFNIEDEWHVQGSRCEEEGDYTRALYFYGLCLEQLTRPAFQGNNDNQVQQQQQHQQEELDERNTISLLHKIGNIQWKIGSYDLSIKSLEEALGKARTLISNHMEQDHNDDDPHCCREEKETLAEILNSIGRAYVSQGSYDTAMDYHVESLSILQSIQIISLNVDEDSIAMSSTIDVHDEKSLIEEEELFEKINYSPSQDRRCESHELEEAMKLSLHPGIARTMICIGTIQNLKGNYSVAMARFRDGYEIQRKTVGPDHVDIGATLNSIGSVYEKNGDHGKAMRCYKKAHRVYKKQLGVMHVDVAVTLNNIGQVYHVLKKYKKAMSAFNDALRIMTTLLGQDHRNVATTLYNKALLYITIGENHKALQILRDTLSSQIMALGEYHADVALTLQSLGDVYEQIGNLGKAKTHTNKALKIRRRAFGDDHLLIAMTLDKLGQLYLKGDADWEIAKRRFRQALQCYRLNYLDENDPRIVKALQNLQVASKYT